MESEKPKEPLLEPLVQHKNLEGQKDVLRDLMENITRIRKETRELNQGIQTQRKGYGKFQVQLEAFNIRIEDFVKSLFK